jgi:hypothetical protein
MNNNLKLEAVGVSSSTSKLEDLQLGHLDPE